MNILNVVQSQYLAALKMLKEAIVKCPPSVWDAPQDKDKFWYKAQHALYWAHRNLQATDKHFVPWKGHRKPDGRVPISKEDLLEYLAFIEKRVADRNTAADFAEPRSQGLRFDRLEVAIASIRHIQQHTGELYERLGSREGTRLSWTEYVHRKQT